MVKKKDDTWAFCVDYKRLNVIIVKDKFPILIINKLLDELNGATIFFKVGIEIELSSN